MDLLEQPRLAGDGVHGGDRHLAQGLHRRRDRLLARGIDRPLRPFGEAADGPAAQDHPVGRPLLDRHEPHRLDPVDAEDRHVAGPLELRVLRGELGRDLRRQRLEHVAVRGAGLRLAQLLGQKEGQSAMAYAARLLHLAGLLVPPASGEEDVLLAEREPAAGADVPAAVERSVGCHRNRRGRQLIRRPQIRLDPTHLAAEVVANDGSRMTTVEDQGDVGGLRRQVLEPEIDLVVLDVAVLMGGAAAVVGDDRLVEPVRLIPLDVGHLGPMAAVVDHHDVLGAGPLGKVLHGAEDPLPRGLLVGEQRDLALREMERARENLAHDLDVIDAARELPPGGEFRVAVDPDQQGPLLAVVGAGAHGGAISFQIPLETAVGVLFRGDEPSRPPGRENPTP